jgi:hypothetical protein
MSSVGLMKRLRTASTDWSMLQMLATGMGLSVLSMGVFWYRGTQDVEKRLAPADRARDAKLFTLAADMYARTLCSVKTRPVVMARLADLHRDCTHDVDAEIHARIELVDSRRAVIATSSALRRVAADEELTASNEDAASLDDLMRIRTLQRIQLESIDIESLRERKLARLVSQFCRD